MRARLLTALESLGAAGVVAIGVFLHCAGFYFFGVAPLERELQDRQRVAAQARAKTLQAQPASFDRHDEIERIYALFQNVDAVTDDLARLHRFAAATGLNITKVDYRLERRDAGLAAFQASLPLRGSYGDVRRFLGKVLKEMPTVSIDTVRFERKRAAEAQLDAHVQLTLYFRPAQAKER